MPVLDVEIFYVEIDNELPRNKIKGKYSRTSIAESLNMEDSQLGVL